MDKFKTEDNILRDLFSQSEKLDKEINDIFKKRRTLDEKVEARKLVLFKDSKIISQIGWEIKIGKNDILYLVPDVNNNNYHIWHDLFFKSYSTSSYHYRIECGNYSVRVNDSDIHIEIDGNSDIVSVIKELGLTITKNEISEKKKEIETNLKKYQELEKHLNS